MPTNKLHGCTVLVTRPAIFAAGLCGAIERHGGRAVSFPVIEFEPPTDPALLAHSVDRLATFDWAIFVSIPAIRSVLSLLKQRQLTWPDGTSIAVVGQGSAAACQTAGLKVKLVPLTQQNSEGLVTAFSNYDLATNSIVIFRGQTGRDLLPQSLSRRAARVITVESYRRQPAHNDPGPVEQLLANQQIDVIVITSQSSYDCLRQLINRRHLPKLAQTPLLTVSRRVADYCRQLGASAAIQVAASAADDDILNALAARVC